MTIIDQETQEITDDQTALVQLDSAWHALAELRTVRGALDLSDRAATIQYWLKRSGAELTVQNKAATVRLLSDHKAGQLLKELPTEPGRRTDLEEPCNIVLQGS